jgi:hypothetical protein
MLLQSLLVLQVSSREVELEGLKSHLTRLLSGLDAHREAEQQVLAGHTARLSKEAARLEALQVRRTGSVTLSSNDPELQGKEGVGRDQHQFACMPK